MEKLIINEDLSPKNDVIFKELFSKQGNEDLLIDFLSSILNKKIRSVEVKKDVHLSIDYLEEKYGILDLCALLSTGEVVDIEMQVMLQKDLFKRMEYYASKLTTSQLSKGERYINLKPVIVVAILDFNILDVEEYITETKVVLDKHRDYEILNMHKYYIVELPKFRKKCFDLNNTLEQWLTFIDMKNIKGVKQAMENNKKIEKAEEEYKYLTGEEEVRRRAELRLKYIRDTDAAIEYAKEQGIERGKIESLKETVKKMKKENCNIEFISKITGFTKEEIEKL